MKKWISIFIMACFLILITGCNSNYKLTPQEEVAYTTLRLAIAMSENNKLGSITENQLNNLKDAVKKFNKNAEWFNDYSGTFYGKTKDTSDYQIDLICNEDYCAKFTIKNNQVNYSLIEYSFQENTEKELIEISVED